MNTLNKKIAFFIAALMFAVSFSVSASGNENKSDSAYSTFESGLTFVAETMSDVELNEIIFSLEDETTTWLDDVVTYYIYDSEDNLIMKKQTSRVAPLNDAELVKTLAKSDLLMTDNNEVYYRLND